MRPRERRSESERHAAAWVCALLAIDGPALGGVWLQGASGGAAAAWVDELQAVPRRSRRLPLNIADDRLLGGVDLAATLASGRAVLAPGVLADSDGALIWLPMAERLTSARAAQLAAVLDRQEVLFERDGFSRRWPSRVALVALDEAGADEPGLPPSLGDRLAFWVRPGQGKGAGDLRDVSEVSGADAAPPPLPSQPAEIEALQAQATRVQVPEALQQALCVAAARLGIASLRALLFALRVVRVSAGLNGRSVADDADALRALQLVLLPRATMLPATPQEVVDPQTDDSADAPADDAEHEPPAEAEAPPSADEAIKPPPGADNAGAESPQPTTDTPLEDRLIAAAQALLPAELLAALVGGAQRNGATGRRGAVTRSATRGRPAGVRPGAPGGGARLAIVDTLRAAAPWQRMRRDEGAQRAAASPAVHKPIRLQVRASDLRTWRLEHHAATAVVFVVDASGSSALHRLGEAKGAVQLLLADCYVRRDEVAVVAFRGRGAEMLLPPTRSLVRARRALAGLPGGGGTPLAAGLLLGARVAAQIQRAGKQPSLVLLTDGRANVCLNGQGGRPAAEADALREARRCRALGLPCLVVDTSSQPAAAARRLAEALGARYEPLPHARADGVARIVAQQMQPATAKRGGG